MKSNDAILDFVQKSKSLSDQHQSWCHDQAIIMLYKRFENLIFEILVGVINNDTRGTISTKLGVSFPQHLSSSICQYLIIQDGYFDFKGRDGLIKLLKKYLPDTHYLLCCVTNTKYKKAIGQLYTLRNFAAHESPQSKNAVLKELGIERIQSSGAWLKKQDRLQSIVEDLNMLAQELEQNAPY